MFIICTYPIISNLYMKHFVPFSASILIKKGEVLSSVRISFALLSLDICWSYLPCWKYEKESMEQRNGTIWYEVVCSTSYKVVMWRFVLESLKTFCFSIKATKWVGPSEDTTITEIRFHTTSLLKIHKSLVMDLILQPSILVHYFRTGHIKYLQALKKSDNDETIDVSRERYDVLRYHTVTLCIITFSVGSAWTGGDVALYLNLCYIMLQTITAVLVLHKYGLNKQHMFVW